MKRILIVEDEPILFAKLERLLKSDYQLYPFTPSVSEAIKRVDKLRPDLVLLDIDLEGEYSGLDLGKKLNDHYQIPFIYVTQHKDTPTFTQALFTGHEQYVVKTKPTLNKQELLNAIQTVLFKNEQRKEIPNRQGVLATDDYKNKLKGLNAKQQVRSAIKYDDIALISTKRFLSDGEMKNVEKNYVAVNTIANEWYVRPGTLKEFKEALPDYFLQVSDGEIVNFKESSFKGRINGKNVLINNQIIEIGRQFRPTVDTYIKGLYGE